MTHSLFESIKHSVDGVEFWYAGELYLDTNWNKFQDVIARAKESIRMSGTSPAEDKKVLPKKIQKFKASLQLSKLME